MKIYIGLFILSIISLSSQDRQRLGESELKNAKKIDFKNREGVKADSSTRQRNEEIGRILAEKINRNSDKTALYKGITVDRLPSSEKNLFGADIITLGNEIKFGHINSLQRVFSSYIQENFDYNPSDAQVIARYLLYYNAMHRNEKSYFREKFTPSVIQNLNVNTVGISTYYRDWAGSSQIVLPLEISPITKKVEIPLLELEKEVDKVIESKIGGEADKKRIIEIIKENKKEEEKIARIQTEKRLEEKINQSGEKKVLPSIEKKESETKNEKVSEKTTEKIKEDRKEPEEKPKESKAETPQKSEKSEAKEEAPKKEDIAAKISETPKEEKKAEPIPQETKKNPEVEKLQKENEELKAKEKEKEAKSENVVGDKVLFLRFVKYEEDGHYTNELWMLDAKNEETIYRSPYTNICGKEFHVLPKGGVVVIGFDGNRPTERIHRLVLLDQEKLSQKSISKQEIFYRSHLIVKEDKIYAFEKMKDQVFFSRFNPDLSLDVRSSEPVNTSSEITFFNDKIFLTGKASETEETVIRVLQKSDLKITKTIKPLERKR